MVMRVMVRNLCLTAFTLVLVAGMGYAKFWDFSSNHGPHNRATVQIAQTSKLASGAELRPGKYEVRVTKQGNHAMVAFYQLNKLVVQAPAKLVNTSQKIERTEVDYNTPPGRTAEMTSMEFSGWHRKIVLTPSKSGT